MEKGSKNKFLSQCETEASISPMINMLSGKKKNKKKNKKKLLSSNDMELNESYTQSEIGGKMKKHIHKEKQKSLEESQLNVSGGKKKKKDKKSKHNTSSLGSSENYEDDIFKGETKKKKDRDKKRKVSSSANLQLNESLESDAFEDSPKKKKKKKSKKREAEEEEEEEEEESSFLLKSPKKMKLEKQESLPSKSTSKKKETVAEELKINSPVKMNGTSNSPKKKGKSFAKNDLERKDKEEPSPVKENGGIEEQASEEDEQWTMEEEISLIDNLQKNLNPKETCYYRSTLQKVNWEEISFGKRSAHECEEMFQRLISKISKYKTLTMLLDEARDIALDSSVRLKRLVTPKNRFIKHYCKKNRPDGASSAELRMEAAAAWLNLPKEEKKQYEDKYKNEMKRHKRSMDLPPERPRSPFAVYYDIRSKEFDSKNRERKLKLSKVFNEMDIEEKAPYIHESMKEWAHYIEQYNAYQASHPDWNKTKLILTSRTIFNEYLNHLCMPRCIASVTGLLYEDLKKKGQVIEGNKLTGLMAMYKELSQDEKDAYAMKLKKSLLLFNQEYKAWKEKQSKEVILVVETYIEGKGRASRAKESFEFENVIQVSMTKPKFPDEPEKPPSAFNMFTIKFERRHKDTYKTWKETREACNSAWKMLPVESKQKYEKREKENKATYKENVLEYVRNLGDGVGVYLGFRRSDLCKYFKDDIFESEFPNDQFPVYENKRPKSIKFENVAHVSMGRPSYPDEPEKPPSNAFHIFSLRFERRNKGKYKTVKERREACNYTWKTLSNENKLKYEERLKEIRATYKKNILEFVRKLRDDAKIYLGFKRKEFYNYFKEDIFEKEYPQSHFPVYVMEKRLSGVLASTQKLAESSSDDDDDDDSMENVSQSSPSTSMSQQIAKHPSRDSDSDEEEEEQEEAEESDDDEEDDDNDAEKEEDDEGENEDDDEDSDDAQEDNDEEEESDDDDD